MGYYAIRVDTDELENSARKAEEFVRVYDNKMKNISGGISGASAYWQGEEYTLFSNKWHEMEAGGSVSEKAKQAMKNYAAYLRYAKDSYKRAQENARRRARGL